MANDHCCNGTRSVLYLRCAFKEIEGNMGIKVSVSDSISWCKLWMGNREQEWGECDLYPCMSYGYILHKSV